MNKQLKSLGEISNMILDLKLAELQRITQQITALQDKNQQLDAARQSRGEVVTEQSNPDPARFSGQDEAWSYWASEQRRAHNMELALLYAEREEVLSQARTAFGRAKVIKTLMAQSNSTSRQ
ncbi:hypothetical protein O2N63_01810 [Aliiroseovarius sp. KMU-50]|uniref:Uncharacterized protein n=1 Tax=Aliiroseovarius salicola TaxID=3009082 RepID=A0ABT4VX41_9RHOB|nr:hypothetical protein [Aliiroseovarius sp. KMU-50]MDA5092818.1 hypothetical protein [Aliiroseovarius sp. KMU-50]